MNRIAVATALLFLAAPHAGAAAPAPRKTVRVDSTAQLHAALEAAAPGTRIQLAAGRYRGGLHVAGPRGQEGAPITVAGPAAGDAAVFTGAVQFSDPRFLVLEDFRIDGSQTNGLNIDDGGSYETPASRIVLRRLTVTDTGPRGNRDGIKLSGVADFLVDRCTVAAWGSGGSAIDMVGCRRGLFHRCTIDGRRRAAATGIQCKGGSSDIVIRRCAFVQAGGRAVNIGGSTGEAYYRPPGAKYDSRTVTVTGCTFTGSLAPIVFVGTERSRVVYNTIWRPEKWILRILQEKPSPPYVPCRENTFAHNLVVWRASDVRVHVNVGPNTRPKTFTFAENAWRAAGAPGRSRPRLPAPETGGVYGTEIAVTATDGRVTVDGDDIRFGHAAPGEEKTWEAAARQQVPWAAARLEAGGGRE